MAKLYHDDLIGIIVTDDLTFLARVSCHVRDQIVNKKTGFRGGYRNLGGVESEAPKAPRGGVWEGGVPLPSWVGFGEEL